VAALPRLALVPLGVLVLRRDQQPDDRPEDREHEPGAEAGLLAVALRARQLDAVIALSSQM
jgi:hypothetical protein